MEVSTIPTVTKSHNIERRAINYVKTIFTNFGWVVDEIGQDYGEDLYIKIPIEEEIGTYNSLKVQVKGTTNPYYAQDLNLRYSFDLQHLDLWIKSENPILLCVVDLSSEEPLGFWRCIDNEIEDLIESSPATKKITISFPRRNRLDFEQCKHKIAVSVFWFYQDGYDISTTKGHRVKQVVEKNIEYILKEVPRITVITDFINCLFPWNDVIDEFEALLKWLKRHEITRWPTDWYIAKAELFLGANKPEISLQILNDIEGKKFTDEHQIEILWFKALSFLESYRLTEAEDTFRKITHELPQNSSAWSNLGIVRRRLGKVEEAINAHNNALKLNPQELSSLASLGSCYRDLKQYQQAIRTYERALKVNSEYAPALFGMAGTKKDLGDFKEAAHIYESVLPQIEYLNSHEGIVALIGYAAVLRKLERLDEARKIYENVLKMRPNQEYALTGYGWVLYDLELYEQSKKAFEKALSLNPHSKYANSGLKIIKRKLL